MAWFEFAKVEIEDKEEIKVKGQYARDCLWQAAYKPKASNPIGSEWLEVDPWVFRFKCTEVWVPSPNLFETIAFPIYFIFRW